MSADSPEAEAPSDRSLGRLLSWADFLESAAILEICRIEPEQRGPFTLKRRPHSEGGLGGFGGGGLDSMSLTGTSKAEADQMYTARFFCGHSDCETRQVFDLEPRQCLAWDEAGTMRHFLLYRCRNCQTTQILFAVCLYVSVDEAAGILIRVSSPDQAENGVGLLFQEDIGRHHAVSLGLPVFAVYQEAGGEA